MFSISEENKELVIAINEIPFYASGPHLSFEEFRANEDLLLHYDQSFTPTDYMEDLEYWTKVQFCVERNDEAHILEFFDQTIDSITVFLRKDSAEYQVWNMGDQYYFEEKPFLHKNFQVPLDGAGEYTLYLRIKSRNYADIRFAVRSVNRFIQYAINEYYLYGIFYGMILIISLYNVSIFSAIGEVKYIYYTLYVLSVGLFAMCIDGIAYQYLWPYAPNWNHIAHGVALFSIIFWATLFSKAFLKLRNRAPKINRLLNVVLILRTIIFLYALFIDTSVFNYRNIEIVPLLLIFMGSVVVFRTSYKPARFFIVAYGFLFLGFLIKALLRFSVFPLAFLQSSLLQIISYYSLHICFVFEMLFLSLALSDRVRILKDNRDRAHKRIILQHEENAALKDQLNAQLESQVEQRTHELKEKNELLFRQKQEISEINSILDLDNWRLRNNIKSIQRERLLDKELTYEEFKEVFPDKDTCSKSLESLKWKLGYSCIRCENTSYSEGNAPYSRRCSKCGYQESPTNNTLFHGVKFPLEKAFYILYETLNKDQYSLAEFSEILSLRKNTISDFKKRIHQKPDEKMNLKEIFKNLEELIQ